MSEPLGVSWSGEIEESTPKRLSHKNSKAKSFLTLGLSILNLYHNPGTNQMANCGCPVEQVNEDACLLFVKMIF